MKKIVWIPLIIVLAGVGIAALGWINGGANGVWFDRLGLHVSAKGERGDLAKMDEVYKKGFSGVEVDAAYLGRVVVKEGEAFSVRGANYERWGGLTAEVKDGTLRVKARENGRWGGGANFGDDGWNIGVDAFWEDDKSFLEITVPKGTRLEGVSVVLGAGEAEVRGVECGVLSVDNSFGGVKASGVRAREMAFGLSAGELSLSDVKAEGALTAKNDYGAVRLGAVWAGTLTLELSAGELEADMVYADVLRVDSDFGEVDIEGLQLSGEGRVKCGSGSVEIGLLMGEGEVSYELEADSGRVSVDGNRRGGSAARLGNGDGASLRVDVDFGDIDVRFGGNGRSKMDD